MIDLLKNNDLMNQAYDQAMTDGVTQNNEIGITVNPGDPADLVVNGYSLAFVEAEQNGTMTFLQSAALSARAGQFTKKFAAIQKKRKAANVQG